MPKGVWRVLKVLGGVVGEGRCRGGVRGVRGFRLLVEEGEVVVVVLGGERGVAVSRPVRQRRP
jgi:hypothetical protein